MHTDVSKTAKTVTDLQPEDIYGTPEKLLATSTLSHEEKVRLMQQWATDLEGRLRASDENMAGHQPGQIGDMLQRVKNAQRALETSHQR